MEKVVVLHSGGLDSTALLYHLRDTGFDVHPISVNYGQRHSRELEAAHAICVAGHFPGQLVDLSSLRYVMRGSSQTEGGIDVPEGHYSEDNMAITVVPNRNMVLLSIATAYAISLRAGWVAYAAHAGDHAQYPDCRQVFIDAIEQAIDLCDDHSPALMAPYSRMSKAQIVIDGYNHQAPFGLTWSCYRGKDIHCGRCGTCVERAEAFHLAGVPDPTEYQDSVFWKTVTKNA